MACHTSSNGLLIYEPEAEWTRTSRPDYLRGPFQFIQKTEDCQSSMSGYYSLTESGYGPDVGRFRPIKKFEDFHQRNLIFFPVFGILQ